MESDFFIILTAAAIYAAGTISPGPSFTLIVKLAGSESRTSAYGGTVGLSLGAFTYAVAAMTGFAIIITKIGWVVILVQCAGATYLVYLGLSPWFSSGPSKANLSPRSPAPKMSGQRGFRTGLIVELSNPKSIAFFLSVFAVSVPPDAAVWVKASVLCIGFTVDIFWYGAVATFFSSKAIRTVYERFVSLIDRLLGIVLVGFGLKIIAEQL